MFSNGGSFKNLLEPLLVSSKFVGLYPNEIPSGKDSKIGIVFSVIIATFFTVYSTYTSWSVYSSDFGVGNSFAETIATIGDVGEMLMSLATSVAITVSGLTMRSQLEQLLGKMQQFDGEFSKLTPSFRMAREYYTCKVYIIVALATAGLLLCLYLIVDTILFLEEFSFMALGSEVVAYVYPAVTISMFVLQFSVLVLLIKRRFQWINHQISKIQLQTTLTEKDILKLLDSLRLKHQDLCKLSQTLNGIYTVPILFTTLYTFITATLTLFFYFKSSSEAKIRSPVLYASYYVLFGLIHCGQLLLMVLASSATSSEVKLTSDFLHKIAHKSEQIDNYIAYFSCQLFHTTVEFSGCRVFTLNGTLLYSIAGAVTTYLVIVVQFQAGFDVK